MKSAEDEAVLKEEYLSRSEGNEIEKELVDILV